MKCEDCGLDTQTASDCGNPHDGCPRFGIGRVYHGAPGGGKSRLGRYASMPVLNVKECPSCQPLMGGGFCCVGACDD
jgi:hypothetical protein